MQCLDVSVPDQVSIVGFDDTLAARVSYPSITTVGYDFAAMGEAFAILLLEQIEKPLMSPKTLAFSSELSERGSVKEVSKNEKLS